MHTSITSAKAVCIEIQIICLLTRQHADAVLDSLRARKRTEWRRGKTEEINLGKEENFRKKGKKGMEGTKGVIGERWKKESGDGEVNWFTLSAI